MELSFRDLISFRDFGFNKVWIVLTWGKVLV